MLNGDVLSVGLSRWRSCSSAHSVTKRTLKNGHEPPLAANLRDFDEIGCYFVEVLFPKVHTGEVTRVVETRISHVPGGRVKAVFQSEKRSATATMFPRGHDSPRRHQNQIRREGPQRWHHLRSERPMELRSVVFRMWLIISSIHFSPPGSCSSTPPTFQNVSNRIDQSSPPCQQTWRLEQRTRRPFDATRASAER